MHWSALSNRDKNQRTAARKRLFSLSETEQQSTAKSFTLANVSPHFGLHTMRRRPIHIEHSEPEKRKQRNKGLSPSEVCCATFLTAMLRPACVHLSRTQTVRSATRVLQTCLSWSQTGKWNRHLSDTSPEYMLAPPARCCFLPLGTPCFFLLPNMYKVQQSMRGALK